MFVKMVFDVTMLILALSYMTKGFINGMKTARSTGLRTVTCLLGGNADELDTTGITFVNNLEAATFAALDRPVPALELPDTLRERVAKLLPERKYVRGLFSGGTLCYEALILLDSIDIESNVALRKELKRSMSGNTALLCGSWRRRVHAGAAASHH